MGFVERRMPGKTGEGFPRTVDGCGALTRVLNGIRKVLSQERPWCEPFLSGYACWGSMSPLGKLWLWGLRPCAADPRHLVTAAASPARACGFACLWETLAKHHVYAGLGDASARLGLHHRDVLSTVFLEGSEGIYARLSSCRRCWVLALQNAVNTVKNCYAKCWCCSVRFAFVVAGSCAARSWLFSGWFTGFLARGRARPQPQNAAICGCLLRLRFWAGLRAVLLGLLVLGLWRARAIPCEPSGLGPGWGPESWHPRHHLGLATCIT